jgi:hypothetical protein
MNNKTLYAALVALPVAVGAPMGGAAFASTTSQVTVTRSGNTAKTNIQVMFNPSGMTGPTTNVDQTTTTGGSWPLRRPAGIQLSSGVVFAAAAQDPAGGGNYTNIVVGTSHTSGNAAFGGSTAGGSVTECPVSAGNAQCPNDMSNDASNIATAAHGLI